MRRAVFCFLVAPASVALGADWPGSGHRGHRVALVVGNDGYRTLPGLRKARADARAFAGMLKRAGFDASLELDLDQRGFKTALRTFKASLAGGDDAVLFNAGRVFRDCADCPDMVVVAPGSFVMRSQNGEEGHWQAESPANSVNVRKAFALSRYAVTFDQWDLCVRDGTCGAYRANDNGWGRGARPVTNASWLDGQAYVTWLSKRTGRAYRLPAEAERDFAARGGPVAEPLRGTPTLHRIPCREGGAVRAGRASGAVLACLLSACGGGQWGVTIGATPPGTPTGLAAAAGDTAVALSWSPPASGAGGTPTAYRLDVTPAVPRASVTISGTAAVVAGLVPGVQYDFAVGAVNDAGAGPWSGSVRSTPSLANPATYAALTIAGDPNAPTGTFDPSVVSEPGGGAWLAYSSVHYYANAAAQTVKDVSTSIAKSVDGGRTYTFSRTVGAAQGPVAVTDSTAQVCGQSSCTGRWIYEVPFLVRDAGDPDPARAWKLFAHKYFLYPPAANSTIHVLGAIVMWTAPAPDGAWSAERTVLRWPGTPPEIAGGARLDTLDASLSNCLLVTEGSASATPIGIDFAFNCMFASGSGFAGKTILLRSADHAASLRYVSTLTTPADAAIHPGAGFFNAPALKPSADGVPMLVVTPDNGTGTYLGCVAIPFADRAAGTLVRDAGGRLVPILTVSPIAGQFAGACAWDSAVGGILMDDLDTTAAAPFRIVATGKTP